MKTAGFPLMKKYDSFCVIAWFWADLFLYTYCLIENRSGRNSTTAIFDKNVTRKHDNDKNYLLV